MSEVLVSPFAALPIEQIAVRLFGIGLRTTQDDRALPASRVRQRIKVFSVRILALHALNPNANTRPDWQRSALI
ncbi:hypothetical protein [Paeniglutamicibacter antarcticus]|uniref:Uncharacterized protein n=1 Tax=Paeniglutamicibacter antarcticus TaxID=494023 RepID=A0ABP9TMV1_9MICC